MSIEHISTEVALFYMLYGITGVVPLIAAVYLLLRRGNAFAPDVMPPVRLRRWAASFFAASVLGHVLWFLFYMYSHDIHSVWFMLVIVLDYVGMLITISGTMLAMLQDRRRPIWPIFLLMMPFVVIMLLRHLYSDDLFMRIAAIYSILLYVLFFAYMFFSARQYGRWLNDNYADLEHKKVWLSQTLSLVFLLFFIIYAVVDLQSILLYFLHFIELVFYALLLWRVETLQQLAATSQPSPVSPQFSPVISNIDLAQIERLLEEHCVGTQLYLQHDLTLLQLAQAIGTNRSYLSQYFSCKGTTYMRNTD